jgi:His-Xaa-Ser system radical SAM maturase HxsC
VVGISPDGTRVTVLWKAAARHNSLLLTEQCDHSCIMCSQPPKEQDDAWLFDRARRVLELLSADTNQVGLTGGEPTLHADRLIGLLRYLRNRLPRTAVHLLSNGRRFADLEFARRYSDVGHPDLMVGIPLYAPEPALHDWIVQTPGAFAETVRGIAALATLGERVELRIVVQAVNVAVLTRLADFIVRNLPFVSQVALMGLEMTGFARANSSLVWIDPVDYETEIAEAASMLSTARIRTLIYNHPLCVLPRGAWPLAVPSISDWKADLVEGCAACAVRDRCGGVFATSRGQVSRGIRPVLVP